MFNFRQLLGQSGEAAAVKYIKKKKYKIIELNYRNKLGEIDIIAEDQGVVVFLEVKTRSGKGFGSPKESVTLSKQRKLSVVALSWLKSKNMTDVKARFDVVSIVSKKKSTDIELVKNAFDLRFR